jgi:hypothetical protein
MDQKDDLALLRNLLAEISIDAKRLPWAATQPWKESTHIWMEKGLPVVDLHDLNAKLAKRVVRKTLRKAGDLEAGALCIITGIGRNSIGEATLRNISIDIIGKAASENGWGFHPMGPGRLVLVVDEERAPPSATGRLSKTFMFWVYVFILLLFGFLFRSCYLSTGI